MELTAKKFMTAIQIVTCISTLVLIILFFFTDMPISRATLITCLILTAITLVPILTGDSEDEVEEADNE